MEFSLPEDALEAIDNMDQAELYGRVIKVNQAKPQKAAGEKLGSRTAIWEQVSIALFLSFSLRMLWLWLWQWRMRMRFTVCFLRVLIMETLLTGRLRHETQRQRRG